MSEPCTCPWCDCRTKRTKGKTSGIGHFVQADTVVPGAGNPAAWNRYAYTLYNPVKFVDPSGHWWVYGDPTIDDFDPQARWSKYASNEGSTSYAPVTTFEFDPVLLTGGVGEVQVSYSQEPEDDYNDFMWGGDAIPGPYNQVSFPSDPYLSHPPNANPGPELIDLTNEGLVWLRDNTDILYLTSGGWHLEGTGTVFDSEVYGLVNAADYLAKITFRNNTWNQVKIKGVFGFIGNTNVYQNYVDSCPVDGPLDYISPRGSWSAYVPVFSSGDWTISVYFESTIVYTTHGSSFGRFSIPNQ